MQQSETYLSGTCVFVHLCFYLHGDNRSEDMFENDLSVSLSPQRTTKGCLKGVSRLWLELGLG